MLKHQSSAIQSLLNRRGQMSTTAIVFLVLGIVFAVMVVVGAVLIALLLPAVQQARMAARSTQSRNNLKQIGLALHNYHDVYNMFPPGGIYTKNDEPYNAWMTSLLPYVDESRLYDMLNSNEPWTSPTNQPVFQNSIPAYLNPNIGPEHSMVGNLGAAQYAGNSQFFKKNSGRKIREITDGTSNTIMAGEVAGGFMAWGDPANLRDPANGIGTGPNQFGAPAGSRPGVNLLLADGSVRFISNDVDPQIINALASPDGGERVGDF